MVAIRRCFRPSIRHAKRQPNEVVVNRVTSTYILYAVAAIYILFHWTAISAQHQQGTNDSYVILAMFQFQLVSSIPSATTPMASPSSRHFVAPFYDQHRLHLAAAAAVAGGSWVRSGGESFSRRAMGAKSQSGSGPPLTRMHLRSGTSHKCEDRVINTQKPHCRYCASLCRIK